MFEPPKLIYCLYARKSSEQDELQALSIDSQINEMVAIAERQGLEIMDIRKESHSAKASGERPVYNKLITDLRAGYFNGIITWAPDRLSRNAGDLGSLVDLMDQGLLREIRTHGQTFSNSPNEKFLLMILCSQAKLENDNKGVNVKRGLKAKCDMGYRPGVAPLGYINEKYNDKGKKRIMVDAERAPIIKQIFEKVANSYWTGREVFQWLRNDIKFTTRSGKLIVLSSVYRILECPFYYGDFEYPEGSGKFYKGNHEPIITKELFTKARENLEVAPRVKYGAKEFYFTKFITCGSCGSNITAEEKFKKLSDGNLKRYVYYHCIKKIGVECHEPYIREDELLAQIVLQLDEIEFENKGAIEKYQQEVERYQKFSATLSGKNAEMPKKINIRSYVKYVLNEGSREEKREILGSLKTKLVLKNQILKSIS
jgi:site-specific DNA recombinase